MLRMAEAVEGARRGLLRLHGPTWAVTLSIYGGWLAATLFHARIPLLLLVVIGGALTAWHGSLQHETIHGHPKGPTWLARAIGTPPLSLWMPYAVYRETHRRHHATESLTHPGLDPESQLCDAETWARLGWFGRAVWSSQRTVVGRLILGPPVTAIRFWSIELGAIWQNEPGRREVWAWHTCAVLLVLTWVMGVTAMPLWKYLLAFVYPGASLTLLRSFAEHVPAEERDRRTAVVEAGPIFSLLFLNNNLHVAHHRAPHVPWFELPGLWQRERSAAFREGRVIHEGGYLGLLWKYAVRPISKVVAP